MAATMSPEDWQCRVIWDGADFSPCFQERSVPFMLHMDLPDRISYLAQVPLVLIPLSFLILLISRSLASRAGSSVRLSPDRLTSPIGDADLVALESDTILSALAANVLPTSKLSEAETKLNGHEAAEVIEEFGEREDGAVRRWTRVKWCAGVLGGAIWLATTIGAWAILGDWRRIVFPVRPHRDTAT
jgi:hypothetical protein